MLSQEQIQKRLKLNAKVKAQEGSVRAKNFWERSVSRHYCMFKRSWIVDRQEQWKLCKFAQRPVYGKCYGGRTPCLMAKRRSWSTGTFVEK